MSAVNMRLNELLPVMAQEQADMVALVPGSNFQRIFGWEFHQNERPLVVMMTDRGKAVAVVPHLELASFERLGFTGEVFKWRDEAGYDDAFRAACAAIGSVYRIAVEGQRMRVFEYLALARAFPGAQLIDAQRAISRIRLVKTQAEVDLLRKAIAVSEAALTATLAEVRIGLTEKEVEGILLGKLFAAGAHGLSFAPIVAAGSNSAQPHARARSDYRIRQGDALLFDFGAAVEHYNADITRTVFVGHASDEDRAFYVTVAAANAAGRAGARPGMTAAQLDDLVLGVLEASPYAKFMRHKTGHGLGLDVHEDPYIMRGNDAPLTPGMVFTIEPGLYQLGKVGVRIEDDVVVTETGIEVLTSFPRELLVVGTEAASTPVSG